ncbi:hypothetical protein GOODEAATRI_030283 [Goodea atripinnis]|uniref:Uncharacterized protein n=1 Tax=Goodea atripinnis TaxID=208336 RepID=A0ABV0PTC9_9TELE
MNAAMALTNLAQGKDSVSGTTSCIIQKSSHIAEGSNQNLSNIPVYCLAHLSYFLPYLPFTVTMPVGVLNLTQGTMVSCLYYFMASQQNHVWVDSIVNKSGRRRIEAKQ